MHQDTAELLTTYAYSWKEGDDFCLCYAMDTGAFVPLSLLFVIFGVCVLGNNNNNDDDNTYTPPPTCPPPPH